MQIERLDHWVLTVHDIEVSAMFYTEVLGMRRVEFAGGRVALAFGEQKINLHKLGQEFEPKAGKVAAGSADMCFITAEPLTAVAAHLETCQVDIIEGPVERTGALGPIVSLYFRDPDNNLIEVSRYV